MVGVEPRVVRDHVVLDVIDEDGDVCSRKIRTDEADEALSIQLSILSLAYLILSYLDR